MKKLLFTLGLFVAGLNSFGQTQDLINYQAIVRDASGASVTNTLVGVRVAILQGSAVGPEVFSETHGPTTNSYGLINLQIGSGSLTGPALNTIDWAADVYFVQIEVDPAGGTSYTVSTTSQLVSVPYALMARNAENVDDADADPTNEYNTGALMNADTLEITDGGGTIQVDLSSLIDDADADPGNEIQMMTKVGSIITLSGGGGAVTDDVNDADADPTNEYNTSGNLAGTTLNIVDGGGTVSVDLSSLQDGVNDADSDPNNEHNTSANLAGTTLNIIDGGGTVSVDLSSLQDGVNDADADPTNEHNTTVALVGNNLQVTDGGGTLSADLSGLINDADADPTNEYNTSANLAGNTLQINDGGGTVTVDLSSLVDDADNDPTNEHNTSATLAGNDLQITDGGGTLTVDLSPLAAGGGFRVGQFYQGGIIVWVDTTGNGGLIAAPADVLFFGNFDDGGDGNDGESIALSLIDGSANTAALVGSAITYPAAIAADGYSVNGYSDWYLPAIYELEHIMQANYELAMHGAELAFGQFYWSSTQVGIDGLGCLIGDSSTQITQVSSEVNSYRVRCIRQF